MKRSNKRLDEILDRDNVRRAVVEALRGKRDRCDARRFLSHLDANIRDLIARSGDDTYPLGRANQFTIYDPKERTITAPVFAERVLHHAIVNVCEPDFDRWLIADTYACRVGKGRLKALDRARRYAGRYGWFLKLDIRKFFASISHDRLLERLERRFKDPALLRLFARIVRSHSVSPGRGLPIGSLTSQHFANFYLGGVDRRVKEQLRIPGYVRYMDDMALWHDDRSTLVEALRRLEEWIANELELSFKPWPYGNRTAHGMDFLGCRVFRHHMELNARSRTRYRRRMNGLERAYLSGRIGELELQQRATALTAFATAGGVSSWRVRQRVLEASMVGRRWA